MWNIYGALHTEKCIALKVYVRKEEDLKIKNLEKEHQTKFTRRKEIKTKREISEIENKCTVENNKTQFFVKRSQSYFCNGACLGRVKPLARIRPKGRGWSSSQAPQ